MPQQPRLCDYGTNTTLVATGFLGCIRVTLQQQPVHVAVTALSFILLAALAIEKRDKISDIVSRPSGIFLVPHYCASIALALPSFFAPSSSRWHAIQADQLARARLLTHMLVQLASGTLTAPHAHVGTHRHHGQEQI